MKTIYTIAISISLTLNAVSFWTPVRDAVAATGYTASDRQQLADAAEFIGKLPVSK